jgi:hypothetical protein
MKTERGRKPSRLPPDFSTPFPFFAMTLPRLKPQGIPLDSPDSNCLFRPSLDKPFLATPAAIECYGETVLACLAVLQARARTQSGLDYLQVFEDSSKPEPLWFIDDGPGGAITALMPSDY